MIAKISKLLALAEGASTPAEAEACFAKAQALASAHAISLAEARVMGERKQQRTTPIHKTVTVGALRKRTNKHLIRLMSGIAAVNDVKINIASNSTYVILFGFPEDIETCETLWIHIAHRMVQFGEDYLASDDWRKEDETYYGFSSGAVNKQTARSSYYTGFVASLSQRLRETHKREVRLAEERAAAEERAHAGQTTTQPGSLTGEGDRTPGGSRTAIALRAKQQDVDDYYAKTSTARGTWGGDSRPTLYSARSASAGRRDGHRIKLGNSAEVSGGSRALEH